MDTNLLERLVVTVEEFLESIDSKVPFFVAGGSVYSTINGSNHYDDIDVFFYNREDCEHVTSKLNVQTSMSITFDDEDPVISTGPSAYITSNAVTVSSLTKSTLQRQIQFVKLHVGDVHEIFDKFDFNCSKVAFTSDRKFIKSADYTKHITIDERNINGMILTRYYKYKSKKGCKDQDNIALKRIIHFLIDNHTLVFDTGYVGEPNISAYELLNNALLHSPSLEMNIAQYAHDYILSKDAQTRINIFSKSESFRNATIDNVCDELYLFLMLRAFELPGIYSCAERKDVKEKYAEYFI